MNGLAYANDELDLVSKSYDSSGHGELMIGVDAELVHLNHRIGTLLSVHDFVTQLDAVCVRKIETGELSCAQEVGELFLGVFERFGAAGRQVLEQADEFVMRGIPVPRIAILRALLRNPEAGLEMPAVAREARALDDGTGAPRQSPFGPEVLSALSTSGYSQRQIGND